jgi:hypothetical protein
VPELEIAATAEATADAQLLAVSTHSPVKD